MRSVGAYEAKTHLAELLGEVSSGQSIIITKHGHPIARLIPAKSSELNPTKIISLIRESRQGIRLGRLSIKKMLDEGRR